jgi:hypothetical protein
MGSALPGLLAILQKHPDLPASFLTSMLGNFGAMTQAQQQAKAQRRSDFGTNLSSLAMQPGMTPEMLQAQAGVMAPNIAAGKFGQNALSSLSGALPSTGAMTDEEKATLGAELLVGLPENVDPSDHQVLYDLREKAKRLAYGAGVDPEEAATFAEEIWGGLSGTGYEQANVIGRPVNGLSALASGTSSNGAGRSSYGPRAQPGLDR